MSEIFGGILFWIVMAAVIVFLAYYAFGGGNRKQ